MSDDAASSSETPRDAIATRDPWDALRTATAARVALGRAGTSLPTRALLAFELDHARARDAVHRSLDVPRLDAELTALGLQTRLVRSAAADRATYLSRPDLGRRLDDASRAALEAEAATPVDVLLVVADGLSAPGIQDHATAIVAALLPLLDGLALGPVVVADQARVALGDEIGAAFGARVVVVLIGERPGLTAPDSVGLYVTFDPRVGRHDAQRNCISNVRPEGLPPERAARKLAWLLRASLRLSLSGVGLKDGSGLLEAPDR